jgi:hypothetical protein
VRRNTLRAAGIGHGKADHEIQRTGPRDFCVASGVLEPGGLANLFSSSALNASTADGLLYMPPNL